MAKNQVRFLGHTLFQGPIIAINKPLTMTFDAINS